MAEARADYTLTFRRMGDLAAGQGDRVSESFAGVDGFADWLAAWRRRCGDEATSAEARAAAMRGANPAFIPRNHLVEAALEAATGGDLAPFERLRAALERPYDDQPERADLAEPPGDEQWRYRTFCGT
ncbi:MAG: hypothetical protein R3A48_25815 [Polyangiales bacterium]